MCNKIIIKLYTRPYSKSDKSKDLPTYNTLEEGKRQVAFTTLQDQLVFADC